MRRLPDQEWMELRQLLGVAKSGWMPFEQERRLRYLLSNHNPKAATMGMQDVIDLGLFLVGFHGLLRLADGEATLDPVTG